MPSVFPNHSSSLEPVCLSRSPMSTSLSTVYAARAIHRIIKAGQEEATPTAPFAQALPRHDLGHDEALAMVVRAMFYVRCSECVVSGLWGDGSVSRVRRPGQELLGCLHG